jgi:hypothetical protein
MANHELYVGLVLEKLQKVGLYAKLEKCGFHQFEVKFLGYIISRYGVLMDLHKVQIIVDLGYFNFYSKCSMFPWVPQFLLAIHYTLFHDHDPSYSFDLEGSTFFLRS